MRWVMREMRDSARWRPAFPVSSAPLSPPFHAHPPPASSRHRAATLTSSPPWRRCLTPWPQATSTQVRRCPHAAQDQPPPLRPTTPAHHPGPLPRPTTPAHHSDPLKHNVRRRTPCPYRLTGAAALLADALQQQLVKGAGAHAPGPDAAGAAGSHAAAAEALQQALAESVQGPGAYPIGAGPVHWPIGAAPAASPLAALTSRHGQPSAPLAGGAAAPATESSALDGLLLLSACADVQLRTETRSPDSATSENTTKTEPIAAVGAGLDAAPLQARG